MAVTANNEAPAGRAEAALDAAREAHRAGNLTAAQSAYEAILVSDPLNPVALHLLGVTHIQQGNPALAIQFIERALRLKRDDVEATNNLGSALQALGRHEEALACYESARALRPDSPHIHDNVGKVLVALHRHEEAVRSFRQAVAIEPRFAEAHNNLGAALSALDRDVEALSHFECATALSPDHAQAHNNLGNVLQNLGRYEEATDHYREALRIEPRFAEALNNLGNALHEQGDTAAAIECYRKALSIRPDYAIAHHALIFALNRTASDGERIFEQAKIFAAQFERSIPRVEYPNSRDAGRRLKIGYVSGDFRAHAVSYMFEPILASHDHAALEIYCYSNHRNVDDVTRRLMGHADHWRSIERLPDDEAAALVRQDGIDILVDLSGHTTHNRLLVFARKPAPVQVSWLGLPCTTGLAAMDYRMTNAHIEPPGVTDRHNSEKLVRLPSSSCFRPADLPPVNELPALKSGCVTFASFNNFNKITAAAFALWARILERLPQSRLLLVCAPHANAKVRDTFTQLGIAPDRLWLHDTVPLADYLALHHHADIALDTFPYGGGTTTKNAIWMGVPVVALAGSTAVARAGLSHMSQVGLSDFVATDEDEYLEIASRWARDLPALAAVRKGLRARVEAAPLSDPEGRARDVEAAYREMWRAWCRS